MLNLYVPPRCATAKNPDCGGLGLGQGREGSRPNAAETPSGRQIPGGGLVAVLTVSLVLCGAAPAWSQTSGNPGAGPGEQNNGADNPGGQRSPGSDTGQGSTKEGSNPMGALVAVLLIGGVANGDRRDARPAPPGETEEQTGRHV